MPRVLLVDDDQTITSLIKTLLQLEPVDYDVNIATTGADAKTSAHSSPPDVFMIDYHLKDMNGLELLNYLRGQQEFSNTPVIVASGLDVEQAALASGADLFLLKPFEPGDLPGIIMDLIEHGS